MAKMRVARPHEEDQEPGAGWSSPVCPAGLSRREAASGPASAWRARGRSGSIGTTSTPGTADKPDTDVSLCARGPFYDGLPPPPTSVTRLVSPLPRSATVTETLIVPAAERCLTPQWHHLSAVAHGCLRTALTWLAAHNPLRDAASTVSATGRDTVADPAHTRAPVSGAAGSSPMVHGLCRPSPEVWLLSGVAPTT